MKGTSSDEDPLRHLVIQTITIVFFLFGLGESAEMGEEEFESHTVLHIGW